MGTSAPVSATGRTPRMRGRRPGAFPVRRDSTGGGDPLYEARMAERGLFRVRGGPVARVRFALGMTQAALAAALGSDQVYVSYVERGQAFLGEAEADQLAGMLARLAAERGAPLPGLVGRDLLDPRHLPGDAGTEAGLPAPERRPA
jgi:hypothetical protein